MWIAYPQTLTTRDSDSRENLVKTLLCNMKGNLVASYLDSERIQPLRPNWRMCLALEKIRA
jgi:hypothetical protein